MPGPSNLYGVSNPVILPITGEQAGSVTCPASVETTIIFSPAMFAPSSGYFYPIIWWNLFINYGATQPANTTIAAKIGAGSDFDTFVFGSPPLYASNWMIVGGTLSGTPSNAAWAAPGSVLNLTCNPNGQPINCQYIKVVYALFRAPDQ